MNLKKHGIAVSTLIGLLVGSMAFGGHVRPAMAVTGMKFKTETNRQKTSFSEHLTGAKQRLVDVKNSLLKSTVYNHRIIKLAFSKALKRLTPAQEQELVAKMGNKKVADVVSTPELEAAVKQNFTGKLRQRLLKLVAGGTLGLLTVSQLVQQAHAATGGNLSDQVGGPGFFMVDLMIVGTLALIFLYMRPHKSS